MFSFLVISALLGFTRVGDSARVLGLFPHTGMSHQMVFDPLLRRLAEKGHQVTVVSFFPLKNPTANYTDISLEDIASPGLETLDLSMVFENRNAILFNLGLERIVRPLPNMADMALDVCSKLVKFAPLAETLKKEYDVVLVENFNSDCMLGLAHVYGVKAPVVALLSSTIRRSSADRIGVSDNPSYVSYYSDELTFWRRLKNTFYYIYYKLQFRSSMQRREQEIIEKHFGRKIPHLQDLAKNVTLMLMNAFHSLNGVGPLLPGVVEVGGLHLNRKRKTIPSVRQVMRTIQSV